MRIDAADTDDVEAIRGVARAAWQTEYPLTRETAETSVEEWYDTDTVREAIAADDAVVLVARPEDDTDPEVVAGFAHAVLGPETTTAAILRVYVHPDSRRTEVGTDLVATTLRRLRERGAGRVEAMVLAENDVGNEFYRSLGFTLDRTEETTVGGETHEERVYVHGG